MRILSLFSYLLCFFVFLYSAASSSDIFFSVFKQIEKRKDTFLESVNSGQLAKDFRKIEDGKIVCYVYKEFSGICLAQN